MGAKIQDAQRGFIYCEAERLKGCDIQLDYPSVGATENIMLASVFADGETVIRNAAKEPEILDLQNYLQSTGVHVTGAGTSIIRITGGEHKLRNAEHTIITDRIVTGTYMAAAGITGGELLLRNVIPEHLSSIVSILRESGCRIGIKGSTMHVIGPARLRAVDIVRTLPYPGFPTDMQAQMMALMAVTNGISVITEKIYPDRFMHVAELNRMGAHIQREGPHAIVSGVKRLSGAPVMASDLRASACLVLAGLVASGTTSISRIYHLERGYENIEQKLQGLGAKIWREKE